MFKTQRVHILEQAKYSLRTKFENQKVILSHIPSCYCLIYVIKCKQTDLVKAKCKQNIEFRKFKFTFLRNLQEEPTQKKEIYAGISI